MAHSGATVHWIRQLPAHFLCVRVSVRVSVCRAILCIMAPFLDSKDCWIGGRSSVCMICDQFDTQDGTENAEKKNYDKSSFCFCEYNII